ncbi:MAG: hypothetical protein NW203_01560 [Hyphomonadaceae bacterium]|nr:hypothetical protein [Hyphomonadaceae bacterium]
MSRAIALLSLLLLAAASATWAGAVALGRHTPIVRNFIAAELEEQRRTNGALQYHGGFVDDGDFLLMGEVAQADYSRGGVYFFGSSETRTTIKPWELAPGERALIHNYSIADVRHREVYFFIRMLIEERGLLQAGAGRTSIILPTYYFMGRIKDPKVRLWEDYVEKLFERHGEYAYDWDSGIHVRPVSEAERAVRRWRDEAHRFMQIATGARRSLVYPGLRDDAEVAALVGREFPPEWRGIMDEELDYFERTLDYLADKGVRVVVLFPPLAPVHDTMPYRGAYQRDVARILTGRTVRIADYRDVFPPAPIETNRFIADHVHMRYAGQERLHAAYRDLALDELRLMNIAPASAPR